MLFSFSSGPPPFVCELTGKIPMIDLTLCCSSAPACVCVCFGICVCVCLCVCACICGCTDACGCVECSRVVPRELELKP